MKKNFIRVLKMENNFEKYKATDYPLYLYLAYFFEEKSHSYWDYMGPV